MKKQIKLEYLFAAVLVAFGLIIAFPAQAGKYAREPEKCEAVCQRKAEEAQERREDRWDNYVATASQAAPGTNLAQKFNTVILPGLQAAYKAGHAEDIALANRQYKETVALCAAAQNSGSLDKNPCQFGGTLTDLSQRIIDAVGTDFNALGNAFFLINGVDYYSIASLDRQYTFSCETWNVAGNTCLNGSPVPVIYNNGRFCTGWLGCAINVPSATGSGDDNNGSGNNTIILPPGWVFPLGFTPPPGFVINATPSPIPTAAEITKFEITNFRLQEALNGVSYYQVLKEQMAVNHENYQLNLVWGVRGASSCQASCKYVKIDDYLANQNWDELQAQSWPCSNNIDNQTTFSGDVDKEYGSAKTKPRENGIIRYTLSCQGETGSDRKDLLAVVQSFSWFEAIPIIDQ